MSWTPNIPRKDEAADAAQFLSRLGYAVLGIAAPIGVVLNEMAIYVLFPIGVALVTFSSVLDPPEGLRERIGDAARDPIVLIALALFGWTALSILWTPFSVAAGQHTLKLAAWGFAVWLSLTLTREHARATDLYLFPIGLGLTMIAILGTWMAIRQGAPISYDRIQDGGKTLAVLLFPAMGGLAARGRNGYTRVLLIGGFVYTFAIGVTPTMLALFVGFTALSFAVADLERTTRDLSWIFAGLIGLAPLVILVASPVSREIMHARLSSLPAPFPSLSTAFDVVMHDTLRLITGHGFETVARGIRAGVLPPQTPRALLFQIWYELGIVGGFLSAAGVWFAFRAIGAAAPRLAPFLAAALACALTLACLSTDLGDMIWLTVLAIAFISCDIAARSQYRTTRPSAAYLAQF